VVRRVTTYGYDADGNGTLKAYANLGDVVSQTDPLGHAASFAYDHEGRQTSMTDGLGRRIDDTYDGNGKRLTEKWYSSSGSLEQTSSRTETESQRAPLAVETFGRNIGGTFIGELKRPLWPVPLRAVARPLASG
jgi:YD repeat-containing protein